MLRIVKRKTSLNKNKRVYFMSESKLRTQSTVFAVSIIGLVKSLKGKHETIISNQIGRSGSFRLFSLLICHLYVLHQFFQCLAFFLPQRVSLLGVAKAMTRRTGCSRLARAWSFSLSSQPRMQVARPREAASEVR